MTDTAAIRTWEPPAFVDHDETVARSKLVLDRPDIPITETEDIFRIRVHELDWDMAAVIYRPVDEADVLTGADGKKVGIFLVHGGIADYRSVQDVARIYAGKYGCVVVSLNYPGRFYFDDPEHNWPGEPVREDGSVRTPIWLRGEEITRDQYDVVHDTSKRERIGTQILAQARPGTLFWHRMASWPAAFEEAMKDVMARQLPADTFSIYASGHSTGGPCVFMISQRVPNIVGVLAVENSPFGAIQLKMRHWSAVHTKHNDLEDQSAGAIKPGRGDRSDPFNQLSIRTWRDRARYAGAEALGQLGPAAVLRLPWLMEEILDEWKTARAVPQFKAEWLITHNITTSLRAAAEAVGERLHYTPEQTAELVDHYLGLAYPLTGPEAKPVPPVLFCVSKDSPDHFDEVYRVVVLPEFASLNPAPMVRLTNWGAGVHQYYRAEAGLPYGIGAPVVGMFVDAIKGGYFVP